MPLRAVIAIGASAGGIEALRVLARELPKNLEAAVFVVVHFPPTSPSVLPDILTRAGGMPALHPRDGEEIVPGRIYVAPPDHHLLVRRGYVRLTRGPRENGHRPAIDTLFRTAAISYRSAAIGVVLSGNLDDGTVGLREIKRYGGVAVAQDPAEAPYPSMPISAIGHVAVDHVLPVAEMAAVLTALARGRAIHAGVTHMATADDARDARDVGDTQDEEDGVAEHEMDIAELDEAAIVPGDRPGEPSGYGCPDCGGALYILPAGQVLRFRCRVGHAWTAESLFDKQSHTLEEALWTALRALEERAALSREMASRFRRSKHESLAARVEERGRLAEQYARVILAFLRDDAPITDGTGAGAVRGP